MPRPIKYVTDPDCQTTVTPDGPDLKLLIESLNDTMGKLGNMQLFVELNEILFPISGISIMKARIGDKPDPDKPDCMLLHIRLDHARQP